MRWEELTGDQFAGAVEQSQGVCLVPLSVIERHGHHLPLGTDMYIGREVCRRAGRAGAGLVFPDNPYTQIPEARHLPGTISIEGELILRLLDNLCREIARNGLKKIVLVNAHGGNQNLLAIFQRAATVPPPRLCRLRGAFVRADATRRSKSHGTPIWTCTPGRRNQPDPRRPPRSGPHAARAGRMTRASRARLQALQRRRGAYRDLVVCRLSHPLCRRCPAGDGRDRANNCSRRWPTRWPASCACSRRIASPRACWRSSMPRRDHRSTGHQIARRNCIA